MANRHEVEENRGSFRAYRITYYLKDGGRVERYYRLPVGDYSDPDPSSLGYRMEVLENDPTVLLENYFFASDQIRLDSVSVEYYSGEFDTYDQISLTAAQEETLVAAMRKGRLPGNPGKNRLPGGGLGRRQWCPCTSNMSVRTAHGIAGKPCMSPRKPPTPWKP